MSKIRPFSNILVKHMEDRGLTTRTLHERSGLTVDYINKLRSGTRYDPSRQALIALARGLECSVEELC